MRTRIDARYLVAYRDGGHVILENPQVVVDDTTIAYVVPMYKSARWYTPDGRRVLYE